MTTPISPVQDSSAKHPTRREGTAWLVLLALLLFSIAAPVNQFKVPPIMPVLMEAWHLPVSLAGLLMSVYALTGLILAIPAGFILEKAGYRLTCLIAGGSIVLGAAWGAIAGDVASLFVSRVIEGIGTSFMAVLAPAIIAMWFAPRRRGMAMGIWSNWMPLGTVMMLIVAPGLTQQSGWRAVWWFGALYALAATVLAFVFVKPPPAAVGEAGPAPASMAHGAGQVLRNRNLWLLSLTFACFVGAFASFNSFLPTYLNLKRSLSLAQAAQWASLGTIVSIFAAPLGGWLSDRIGSRKWPYTLGMVLNALTLPLVAMANTNGLIALIIAQGVFGGLVPTTIFSAAVEVVGNERHGGLAMGVIQVGQNFGMLAGPILFGAIVDSAGGWAWGFGCVTVLCLVGALAGWLAKVK